MKIIARIHTDFPTKFGIPRQSGLVPSLKGAVIFEPEYRYAEAVRGLEEFSHIWLLWKFSEVPEGAWSPTVRPPRLGGNRRMGVFATRSPFRPNPVGLSCVRLDGIDYGNKNSPVLYVSGADMLDGTPIFDIKPYLPFADSVPDARGGFAESVADKNLSVIIPEELSAKICEKHKNAVLGILAQDPRPSYQNDPERLYGLRFGGMEIKFTVDGNVLKVTDIIKE